MRQKRLMGGCFSILVIILCLQFSCMEAFENKVINFQENQITKRILNSSAISPELDIQLNLTFGGLEMDYAVEAIQTADGGFLIAGSTDTHGTRDYDMWLVKTNANGSMEWNQTYDISCSGWGSSHRASDLIQTTDGGFLIIGTSFQQYFTPFMETGSALKLFANGTVEWCQSYYYDRKESYGDEHCYLHSVIQTTDGGFLLAGRTVDYYSSGPNNMDMWLVKIYTNGSVEWDQIYGSRDDSGYSIIQTTDGGFLIAGETIDYHYTVDFHSSSIIYPHNVDMWLVKIYTNGSVEWNQAYGGPESEYITEVIQTADGGFLMAGITNYWSNDTDIWLVKTYDNGTVKWNQAFGGSEDDHASSVIQTADGGFLIAGRTESYGAGDTDMWLVKTDINGVTKWNQTFGGSERDAASSVIQTADGGFLIVGWTESYGAGKYDMWLLKIFEPIDTTTDSMTETIPEEETSLINTISANTYESKDSSVLIPGFETPSVIVVFLLGVIFLIRRKKVHS